VTLALDIGSRDIARAFIIEQLRCLDTDGPIEQAMLAEAIRSAVIAEADSARCNRRTLLFVALNARRRADLVLGREPADPTANSQVRTRLIEDVLAAGEVGVNGNEAFLPVPIRAVQLEPGCSLLVGTLPTSRLIEELPAVRAAGLLRITDRLDAKAQLPLLSLDEWLGSQRSDRVHDTWLARFERNIGVQLKPIPPSDPARWKAFTRMVAGRYRFGPLPASGLDGLTLCRDDSDATFGQVHDWLVRLERRDGAVHPTVGVALERSASLRYRMAIQARDGVPAVVTLLRSPTQVRLRYTWRFPEPENKIVHAGTVIRGEGIPDLVFRSEFAPLLEELYTTLGVAVNIRNAN
jgi:hypothetical protein